MSPAPSLADAFTKTQAIKPGKRKRTHQLKPVEASMARNLIPAERQRGYVTRAFPSPAQGLGLGRTIGMGRYLWNWMLGVQLDAREKGICLTGPAGQAFLSEEITAKLAKAKQASGRLLTHPADPVMTAEHWLTECPRSLITQKQRDLDKAWKAHGKGTAGLPTFQKRDAKDSIRFQMDARNYDQQICVHDHQIRTALGLKENEPVTGAHRNLACWIKVPKIGRVKLALTEPVHGRVTMATVRRTRLGKLFSKESTRALAVRQATGFKADRVKKNKVQKSNEDSGTSFISSPTSIVDRVPDRWAGFEITLTAKDIPVEKDRPGNWARRLDWEADAWAAGGQGLLGAGLGEIDPHGVVALDLSGPMRAVSSNGDVLGRRDRDAYTEKKAIQLRKHQKHVQRTISHKETCRKTKAGFPQGKPLPKRATWTDFQKSAMVQSKRELAGRARLAKVFATLKAQRTHDAHVFTTWLVLHFHTIVIEGLTLRSMGNSLSRGFRRSFNEAAMGEILRMLDYKCALYGRTLVNVGTWFPSSKRCHQCHTLHHGLKLSDRTWTCANPKCGQVHDRDENATFNLKQEGCRQAGIPLPDDHFVPSPLMAGESPVSGRRGLQAWLKPVVAQPVSPARTAKRISLSDPEEAPRGSGNRLLTCSTLEGRLTRSGTSVGGVRD